MPLPKDFTPFLTGFRMPQGSRLQDLQDAIASVQVGVVALAGGGQAGATPINAAIVALGTVATAGDSVVLPIAVVGYTIRIANLGAASANIFGNTNDTINGAGAGVAFALAAGKNAQLFCYQGQMGGNPGAWRVVLSA